jgi:hypothetical protein
VLDLALKQRVADILTMWRSPRLRTFVLHLPLVGMDISVSDENLRTVHQREPGKRTPLPVKQLLIIAIVLLAEPLTNSIIRSFNDALGSTDPGRNFSDEEKPQASFYSQFLVGQQDIAKSEL